eukprot:gnl/MRDRNA2_/MRDRNA2_59488_c0_seq1.p1 gnl/MRDRNA2_/MRDRNA2_59488_c0~~gnl/MRDRNA2_/MRDRNA2_59488_c0_seq1.p1  ORF type:complete len:337 (+),score=61.05 gnl/MRDRNA2_/MRDRNA2_59488_c0_seq1:50-1060(+)
MGREPRSPGPAAYSPSLTKKHVSSNRGFGHGPARTALSKPEDPGPGPARYVYNPPKRNFVGGKFGSAARMHNHENDGPGPGEYSPSKASPHVSGAEFGSSAQRNARKAPDGPGPAQYMAEKLKSPGISCRGFGHGKKISSPQLPQASVGPGPAAYSHDSPKKKATGNHPKTATMLERASTPGPGEYDVPVDIKPVPCVVGYRSSKELAHYPAPSLRGQAGQGPASYNVSGDISKSVKGKVGYHAGGIAHAASLGRLPDTASPGPGTYLPKEPQRHIPGWYFSSFKQSVPPASPGPGPGEYLKVPEMGAVPGALRYFPSAKSAHSEPHYHMREDWVC